MNIQVTTGNFKFLEVFSSSTRVKMIELLAEKPRSIKELADILEISSPIVTKHIQKMQEAGIVKCESAAGVRGMRKVCSLNVDQVLLRLKDDRSRGSHYALSIPIGHYTSFEISPTCGLASTGKIIGMVDDPRYFADPEHVNAAHLWFGSGWVEYLIPNYLLKNQKAKSISISLEICSEAPGFNENWPSDITFLINGIKLGTWTCPGDFGKSRGIYTPDWWNLGTQHGLLKTILVNQTASYIDGIKISETKISDLGLTYGKGIAFRILSAEDARNRGGVSLFGSGFGNYNQDISVTVEYQDE